MKRFLFAALLLGACGSGGSPAAPENEMVGPSGSRPPDNAVECRLPGSDRFESSCWLSIAGSPEGRVLTIRKPDGGFRRLLVTGEDGNIVAADGAEQAHVATLPDGRIEVEIGGDRFRLGAWVRTR